jgi:hypothetical protein
MAATSTVVHNLSVAGSSHVHVGPNIYHSENPCLRDLRITDPRHDKARIEADKGGLLHDVYRWVLENAEFLRWRQDTQNTLLWVRGDPGKGKTMLLCGMINELEKESSLVSYFFCQATDARINSATAVLRGLIYVLVDRQPSLLVHVQKRYDHAGAGLFKDVNAWVAVREIFTDIMHDPALQSAYLVIDALDECQTGRTELLSLIASGYAAPHVKWVISSRNWPDIEDKLASNSQKVPLSLELNAESVSAAVQLYIEDKVRKLSAQKQYSSDTTAQVKHYLSSNARDTFLWVALVCRSLEDVLPFKALKTLLSFPPGLDALYDRMMQTICEMKDADDVTICLQILSVTSTVYRPLTLEELASLIHHSPQGYEHDHHLESYVRLCGSFLAVREGIVHLVHQSANDFLRSPSFNTNFAKIFPRATGDIHHTLFAKSLDLMSQALRCDMYHLSHAGTAVDDVPPPSPDPLAAARYACFYWVDHLVDALVVDEHKSNNTSKCKDRLQDGLQDGLQDANRVYTFLSAKYLHWLEALSLVRAMPEGVLAIERLYGLLQVCLHHSKDPHNIAYTNQQFSVQRKAHS